MMDFYSEQPMPSLMERKNSLINYAKTTLKLNIDCDLENKIIGIVSETLEYSLSGYAVFGKSDEQQRLKKILNL